MEPSVLAALAHRRLVSADELRRLAGRQKGQCTWCGGPVPKGRRRWCSPACLLEFEVRFNPAWARIHVKRRDHGVCGRCGLDTDRIRRRLSSYSKANGVFSTRHVGGFVHRTNRRGRRNYRRWARWLRVQYALRRLTEWEAHHRLPVVLGGGAMGLDNLETLCRRCHDRETAALAAKRAKPTPPARQQNPQRYLETMMAP